MNLYRLGQEVDSGGRYPRGTWLAGTAVGAMGGIPTSYDPSRGFTRGIGGMPRHDVRPVPLDDIQTVQQAIDYAAGGWHATMRLAEAARAPGNSAALVAKGSLYGQAAARFEWVHDLGTWATRRGIGRAEFAPLVENLKGALRVANRAVADVREGRTTPAATEGGDRTWKFADLAKTLDDGHAKLAAIWPTVRAAAPRLSEREKIQWNALVYVQQGMELQLAAALARTAGAEKQEMAGGALGVFAGLPGGGAPHDPADPRFQVPLLTVRGDRAAVGFLPLLLAPAAAMAAPAAAAVTLKIGMWLILAVVGIAALMAVMRVSGNSARITQHQDSVDATERMYSARLAAWQREAEEARKRGLPPPPIPDLPDLPKPPKEPMGVGAILAAGALSLGGLFLLTRKAA